MVRLVGSVNSSPTVENDTDNINKLVAAFQDPAVQQFLATDPSVKDILLPL